MPEPHVYPESDRPDAEVLVGDEWFPAELRMRTERADGYYYNVSWHRPGEQGNDTYLDTFPAARVRMETVDRSRGRG